MRSRTVQDFTPEHIFGSIAPVAKWKFEVADLLSSGFTQEKCLLLKHVTRFRAVQPAIMGQIPVICLAFGTYVAGVSASLPSRADGTMIRPNPSIAQRDRKAAAPMWTSSAELNDAVSPTPKGLNGNHYENRDGQSQKGPAATKSVRRSVAINNCRQRQTCRRVYSGSRNSGFSTSSMLTSLKVITRTCLTKRAGRYMSQTQASARRSSK